MCKDQGAADLRIIRECLEHYNMNAVIWGPALSRLERFAEVASAPDMEAVVTERDNLRKAIEWVLTDASYKAPEDVGEVPLRWVERLQKAIRR